MWFDFQSLDVPLPAQSGGSIRVSGRQIPFSAHGGQFSTRSAKEGEGERFGGDDDVDDDDNGYNDDGDCDCYDENDGDMRMVMVMVMVVTVKMIFCL